jgi:serine/threonine protein kinase
MTGNIGTLTYMAPEILRNDRLYNQSCDVYRYFICKYFLQYSFGVTMYEVFFEIAPYSSISNIGKSADEEPVVTSLFNLGYKVLTGYRPQVPSLEYTDAEQKYLALMVQCWDQENSERPSFEYMYKEMESL